MNYFYLLTFALFLECSVCALNHENKRLLLNDPDAIVRLANLEQQNQLLTQKVLDLESKMATRQGKSVKRFKHYFCKNTHFIILLLTTKRGRRQINVQFKINILSHYQNINLS